MNAEMAVFVRHKCRKRPNMSLFWPLYTTSKLRPKLWVGVQVLLDSNGNAVHGSDAQARTKLRLRRYIQCIGYL